MVYNTVNKVSKLGLSKVSWLLLWELIEAVRSEKIGLKIQRTLLLCLPEMMQLLWECYSYKRLVLFFWGRYLRTWLSLMSEECGRCERSCKARLWRKMRFRIKYFCPIFPKYYSQMSFFCCYLTFNFSIYPKTLALANILLRYVYFKMSRLSNITQQIN